MTTAIKFSRQIDAGSSVSNTQSWENVILVVVLVSESKRLYFSVRSSRSSTSCNGRPSCYYMNRGGGGGKCRDPRRSSLLVGYTYNWNQYGHLLWNALKLKDLANLTWKEKGTVNGLLSLQFPVTKSASQIKEVYETFSIKVELILTHRISAPTQYELHYPSLLNWPSVWRSRHDDPVPFGACCWLPMQ